MCCLADGIFSEFTHRIAFQTQMEKRPVRNTEGCYVTSIAALFLCNERKGGVMKSENKCLRLGAAVVAMAILLRLFSGSLPDRIISFFSKEEVVMTMLLLQTGRVIRFGKPDAPPQETPTPPVAAEPVVSEDPIDKPVFTGQDTELVQVNNNPGCQIDVGALLAEKLDWQLKGIEPTVLILHTHGSESYIDSCEPGTYRTQDPERNMLGVGGYLEQLLLEAGIGVIRDCALHDYPSYNGSYNHARKSIQQYLAQYPSIRLVLDMHRDAVVDKDGSQRAVSVAMGEETAAQLMLVVGTNAGGLTHPGWQENMALAVKLHAQLERLHPGITRPISLRAQRFNQDLSPGAVLVEVGAAGNTMQEAMKAVEVLAGAIIALSPGANG